MGDASYLPVNSAGEHPFGVGLNGDDSLSHSQIGPSISHHTVLFLTDERSSTESQEFSISEEKKHQWVEQKRDRSGCLTPG